jgi:hypothetical protein
MLCDFNAADVDESDPLGWGGAGPVCGWATEHLFTHSSSNELAVGVCLSTVALARRNSPSREAPRRQ